MSQRDVLSLLEAGNKAQLEKLKENDHKTGFDNLGFQYIYSRLQDEMSELDEEVFKEDIDFIKIRKELANIANFCHMGILTCDKIVKEKNKYKEQIKIKMNNTIKEII